MGGAAISVVKNTDFGLGNKCWDTLAVEFCAQLRNTPGKSQAKRSIKLTFVETSQARSFSLTPPGEAVWELAKAVSATVDCAPEIGNLETAV